MLLERTGVQLIGGGNQDQLSINPPWAGGAELILLAFVVRSGSGEVRLTVDDAAEILKGSDTIKQPAHGLCFVQSSAGTLVLNGMPIRVNQSVSLDFSQGSSQSYLMYYWQRPLPSLLTVDPSIGEIAARTGQLTNTERQKQTWEKMQAQLRQSQKHLPQPKEDQKLGGS